MKSEHRKIISQLPKDLQKSFYFGYIMDMADDLGKWDETIDWFYSVRHIQDLKSKSREYEGLLKMLEEECDEK